MITKGLIVRLEAKAGKEEDVAAFLAGARPLVEDEPETVAWWAVRAGASTFWIVDVFPDEAARRAHLDGAVAAALGAQAGELLSEAPEIQHVDVLAAKVRRSPDRAPARRPRAWHSSNTRRRSGP